MNGRKSISVAFSIALLLLGIRGSNASDDWPTYRHDNRRSGVTDQSLRFPMKSLWTWRSKQRPQPAWTGPAKWDAWAKNQGLQSLRNFDPCFFVTAAGGRIFFGSSADDAVHALDAKSGEELWTHFTSAPVRLPPTLFEQRAYFGSDDGRVYCCDASSGSLLWKLDAAPSSRRITNNRKIISLWPVRTGVMIENGQAVFASSLVPWEPSILWSVDAETGKQVDGIGYRHELAGVTMQGAMLASSERVFVPQGRAAPLTFDRISGKPLGTVGEAGGVFCILTDDEMLISGPNNQKSPNDQIRIADGTTRQRLVSFSGANRILVEGNHAWVPSNGALRMLDRSKYIKWQQEIDKQSKLREKRRKEKLPTDEIDAAIKVAARNQEAAWLWTTPCPNPHGFIKTKNSIVVGADHEVSAYSTVDGSLQWHAVVDGVAFGLAVAEDRLFVSTSNGHIHAFESAP